MASPDMLEMVLDIMREAWEQFERTQRYLHRHYTRALTHDEDLLLLYACDITFNTNSKAPRHLENPIVGDIHATTHSPEWNTAEERCHRFLLRSTDNSQGLYSSYQYMTHCTQETDDFCSGMWTHLHALTRLVTRLVKPRISALASYQWTCTRQDCDADTHIHSADGTVWPSQEKRLEKDLPIAACPRLGWRQFKYAPITIHGRARSTMDSAAEALDMVISQAQGKEIYLDHSWLQACVDIEKLWRDGYLLRGLAELCLSMVNLVNRQAEGALYNLCIILPGGSRVFEPLSPVGYDATNIYIKLNHCFGDLDMPCTFQAVKRLPEDADTNATQTVEFLTLPPEVRNMIYELVLPRVTGQSGWARRQPAISRTCRTVNMEFLSLLWQKYGWLVCK